MGAAFFDLDRTLISGASGPVFSAAMRELGLLGAPLPGEQLMYGVFNRFGENMISMMLARQAARLARGQPQRTVQLAGEHAADPLLLMVRPLVDGLLDEHRGAGRLLVMATTTPADLVRPLAARLGFDDVVATRYGVGDDGAYNGGIDGPFVWAHGKLAAVTQWAEQHGVDLSASYAYSDSIYDTPLLSAVGHPFVINPDPRLRLAAASRQWPTLELGSPSSNGGGRANLGRDLQRLGMQLVHPEVLMPFARFDVAGEDLVPATGPVILVANHRSYFDSAAIGVLIARTGRAVRFLGKKEVFDAPVVGQLMKAMGGIRVDRGTGSDEPLKAAAEALEAGDMVALMPQGTIPRGPAFFEPELKGRWGAARLAAMTHAPVVPVGLWGTERVWPRSARVPNVLTVTDPPEIRVRVGPPVDLKYRSADADTKRIMAALVDLLPAEARVHRVPTEEELARTFPPGYRGDAAKEADRRPGTD
jgi:putative phosphoserine phosphatase/1-acylglycerol-3-phosphate O-acyltransferase